MKLNTNRSQFSGLAVLLFLTALAGFAQGTGANSWKIIGPGGGGTTIGPTISPHDPKLVVEHCDMTGGYVTRDDGQSWRMFNLRGVINVFAFDPADPKIIYAGNAALWRSSDSGRTWKMFFPSPARNTVEHQIGDHSDYSLTSDDPAYPGGDITAIAIAPGTPEHLYLAFRYRGHSAVDHSGSGPIDPDGTVLVSSADGGVSWKRLANLPQGIQLLALESSSLIAVTDSAAWRIAPDGSATELGGIASGIHAASAAKSGGSVWIYATGKDGRVYLSKDSGLHFTPGTPSLGQSAGSFEAIAASHLHPEVAYVGFRGLQIGAGKENLFNGIAKTTDGGKTWKIVFKESNRPAVNLSATWIEKRAMQDSDDIWFDSPYSLGVAPGNPDVAYAADLFRTYRTLDGGATWQEMNSEQTSDGSWVSRGLDVTTNYGVQFDPFDSKHIYMDNTDMGLFQSTDGGQSWQTTSDGVPDEWRNTTYWLAFDPTQRGLIWGAFSGQHDLPRPKDWRHNSPKNFMGEVAVSTDGGHHWEPSISGMPAHSITHILLDPSSPVGSRTLYACAFGLGVYKSIDNGKTWTQKNNGIAGEEPFAWRITLSQDGSLYLVVSRRSEGKDYSAAGAGALYRSTDKAEHWQRMDMPAGVTGPTGLEIDPRDAQRLYLTAWGKEGDSADMNGGVYGSDDGGKTWRTLYTKSQHVYDLTIDAKHPDTLYICGFDAAAYRSTDRGVHWERIKGYDFKWGHRVILDPNDSTQIYITTYGGGVWHGPAAGTPKPTEAIVTPVPIAQ
ncbi:MAG: VPS10 domain-containing protein [Terracidiphilus sp.]